jgi:hypothetical protein
MHWLGTAALHAAAFVVLVAAAAAVIRQLSDWNLRPTDTLTADITCDATEAIAALDDLSWQAARHQADPAGFVEELADRAGIDPDPDAPAKRVVADLPTLADQQAPRMPSYHRPTVLR